MSTTDQKPKSLSLFFIMYNTHTLSMWITRRSLAHLFSPSIFSSLHPDTLLPVRLNGGGLTSLAEGLPWRLAPWQSLAWSRSPGSSHRASAPQGVCACDSVSEKKLRTFVSAAMWQCARTHAECVSNRVWLMSVCVCVCVCACACACVFVVRVQKRDKGTKTRRRKCFETSIKN